MASKSNEEVAQRWYDHKSALLEKTLGKQHDTVMHAIIPYAVGGCLDLYYYPNGIPGTAIATKELSEMPNQGSSNAIYRSYELVMFTRLPLALNEALNDQTPFGQIHSVINSILNHTARYSASAKLDPNETSEFSDEMGAASGRCIIFDGYACHSDRLAKNFGLLLLMQVFRSEMDFARECGGAELIKKLKAEGFYPYSDLDREPVA
jgi:hypothetical protein